MQMIVEVANAERIAFEVMADVLMPPPPVDYLRWAEDNVVFSKRESPFPGPYNRDLFAYFDEILRAFSPDDPCREISLVKSAQLGGTVLANVFCGGSMDMDPADFMYVHPTENNAQRWSKMKLVPMLKGTSALARIFPMKARDGQDSVLYKERLDGGGAILISGANSPASLSQVTVQRQVQDDLAKWEMNAAGDPETQADSRSRAHEFAKVFKVSTPLVVPGCRITRNFEEGSQERFYVPCPHCGAMQTLEWENFLDSIDAEKPEAACFSCVECGADIEEHHRPAMLRHGEWRAENPKAKRVHRSFYLWSAYSLLQSFERIAREWLNAKGDAASEQTFFNDTIGRAYRTLGEAPPWETLRDRAAQSERERGRVPVGHTILTLGIDCQIDRVEWQVVAWAPDHKRAIVDYGVIPGHISTVACQTVLDGLLQQGFRNAYGRKINVDLAAIDGNAWTEDVWGWAKKHPSSRVIMVRGVASEAAPLLVRVKKETGRSGKKLPYSRRFYNFATSVLKMGLYRNLVQLDPLARAYIDLPRGLEDEFFRQLTAETRKAQRTKTGFIRFDWVKDSTQANEGLDTHLQAEAAFIRIAGPTRQLPDAIWARYAAERELPPDPAQGDLEDLFTAAAQVAVALGQSMTRPSTPAAEPPRPGRARPQRGIRKMRRPD